MRPLLALALHSALSLSLPQDNRAAAAAAAMIGVDTIPVRATPPGPPLLLPTFQQLADYAQAETIGFQHFGNRATNVVANYNASSLCSDPKRPHDVCSPPGLDMNDGYHTTRYLPHLLLNQYRSERTATDMPTISISDDVLKVDVTPQFGGKVYAMRHLPTNTSMLHSPAIRQPIQSSRLSAQVDGGIEWNYSPGVLGHWVGTQQDVWAARLQTSKGPMLRIYEFDRFNESYFQVDMIVKDGTLFAHPKLFNPHQHNLTAYWWACSGLQFTVPAEDTDCSSPNTCVNCQSSKGNRGTRVLTPASDEVDDSLELEPWPHQSGKGGNPPNATTDMSWLSKWITGDDNFIRIEKPQRPHITIVDKDLYGEAVGLAHFHTLNGTKFWSGGQGGGSQRWFDWKDAPASDATGFNPNATNGGAAGNTGCFFEPQVGVGPTQARGFPFPPGTMEWTHTWRTLHGLASDKVETLYGEDYQAALDVVGDWVELPEGGIPAATAESMDKFFREEASIMQVHKGDLLHSGQPYGVLQTALLRKRGLDQVPESMRFAEEDLTESQRAEIRPWMELLKDGTFSEATLSPSYVPLSYMVSSHWEELLEASVSEHGVTHVHLLHLGIIAAERLDLPRALDLLSRSVKQTPTAIAYRCLAALGLDSAASWGHYQSAWKLAVQQQEGQQLNDHARNTTLDENEDLPLQLQRQLAGEIALWLTTVSMLADHNLTFNGNIPQSMWPALDEFISTAVPAAPGCRDRGGFCDHDMIAFAVMHRSYQRGTVEGCKQTLEILETWPFITDAGDSYVFSRKPHLQPHYSPKQGDQDGSWWTQCLIMIETEKVGHALTQKEITALLKANEPPYWLTFDLS